MRKILIIICSVIAVVLTSCEKKDNTFQTDLIQEIRSNNKMILASMSITKTAKMESSDWYTIGKRIAVYSYDSYMRAFIDLSILQADDIVFDDDKMTVKITLPPIQTEITGRDMEMRKEYENIGLLRSDLDSKERAEIKEKANASFKKEVAENPVFQKQLVENAKRKARSYFESLFSSIGYTATIEFK